MTVRLGHERIFHMILPGCSPEHRVFRRRHVRQLVTMDLSILHFRGKAHDIRGVNPAALRLRLAIGCDEADLPMTHRIAVFLVGRRKAHCEQQHLTLVTTHWALGYLSARLRRECRRRFDRAGKDLGR